MIRRPYRRGGYTLVEMSIAAVIATVVFMAVMSLLVSGSRLFASGQNAVRGPEAAILIMDRLERDMAQVIQVPGDPRPPVAIDDDGHRVCFYVPGADGVLSTPRTVVGVPVWWDLVRSKEISGAYHPVRNGEVLDSVALIDWEITLWSPKESKKLPGWYLTVRLRFRADNVAGEPYVYARAIHLRQPSTNFTSYPTFGDELNSGLVRMLPPPDVKGFDAIAPPSTEPPPAPQEPPAAGEGSFLGTPGEEGTP